MIEGLYARQLADELLRIMSDRAGWPSTLLRQSTIGLMEELALAGAQAANGVLSPSSFEDLKSQARDQLLIDPGLGPMKARGPLLAQIPRESKEFVPSSYKHKAWVSAIPSMQTAYLRNWRLEFSDDRYKDAAGPAFRDAMPAVDSAGFLASHLLHLGISGSYLSGRINYRSEHDPNIYDLTGILEDVEDVVQNGFGSIEVLVALARPPQDQVRSLQGWLDVRSAREWLEANGLPGPRSMHGAIIYEPQAWDIDGALLSVAKAVHRLQQRAILKTGRAPEFLGSAWLAGVKEPKRLPAISQLGRALAPGYELGEPQLEAPRSDDRLEVSVELLLTALSGSGPSTAGTLWASLEAMLAAPGDPDRIQVTDRAGDIALVTLIRSSIQMSLGQLFSRCPQDVLAQRLSGLGVGERLTQFEAALRRGEHERLQHRNTRVALSHTRRLFETDVLKRTREEIRQTLRGLYRQRNLVLHGGITDAPLLEGILRSSTPLVAGVINRYARASHGVPVDPHIFAYQMLVRLEGYLNDPRLIVQSLWDVS
jgi:hypothetical protein